MILQALPKSVKIVEVGPRDGLQNEGTPIPTERKIAFIDALSECGYQEIEVTAFVRPTRIPQLADAEKVMRGIRRRDGVIYSALVPNEVGLDRALDAGVERVSLFTAASETFNRKNINATIAESIDRFRPVARRARREGISLRGYISTAFVCPYEGLIDPARTVDVVRALLDLGVDEVSIGDTIGTAVPSQVDRLLDALAPVLPVAQTALHLHDTRGTGLPNVLLSLQRGVSTFDAAAGGLGGCPYAPGASGNLATEDLHHLLDRMDIETGIDPDGLGLASGLIEELLEVPLPSRVRRAGAATV